MGERLGLDRLRERGRWKGERRPPPVLDGEAVVEDESLWIVVDGLEVRRGGGGGG